MNEPDPLDPKSLDLPDSREFAQTAALLALAADPLAPPPALKARLLAAIRPEPEPRRARLGWLLPAAALAALLLAPVLKPARAPAARLVSAQGAISIAGRAAAAGAPLRVGETVAVEPGGEALVQVGGGAAVRLTHGGRAVLRRAGSDIEVGLLAGWALSAVAPGRPYAVVTAHGRIAALGTVFLVRAGPRRDYVCICRGRLRLTGGFGEAELAAEGHRDVFISDDAPPVPAAGPLDGHTDADIAAATAALSRP
ncbi:MAG: FecR domain-containing protein [Elusimicrobia bacterium]|nr:FecR domain-containing protein [Elusimicrobiota bacterium]